MKPKSAFQRSIEYCLWIVLILFMVSAFFISVFITRKKYPPVEKLNVTDGIIRHPTYGDYPETVPYKKGGTIYPGQRATITFDIPAGGEKQMPMVDEKNET